MFGIGMPEFLVILVVALIVLGPKRLPDVARLLGRGLAEFRRATEDLTGELRDAQAAIEEEARQAQRAVTRKSAPQRVVERKPPETAPAAETKGGQPGSPAPPAGDAKGGEPVSGVAAPGPASDGGDLGPVAE
jgi:Tat protein translocase TatB subunit